MKPDEEMSDTEMWRAHREDQQARRAARLPARTTDILELADYGFHVRPITQYHFRVNEALDLYPTHRRWHLLSRNARGRYRTALEIATRLLRSTK